MARYQIPDSNQEMNTGGINFFKECLLIGKTGNKNI